MGKNKKKRSSKKGVSTAYREKAVQLLMKINKSNGLVVGTNAVLRLLQKKSLSAVFLVSNQACASIFQALSFWCRETGVPIFTLEEEERNSIKSPVSLTYGIKKEFMNLHQDLQEILNQIRFSKKNQSTSDGPKNSENESIEINAGRYSNFVENVKPNKEPAIETVQFNRKSKPVSNMQANSEKDLTDGRNNNLESNVQPKDELTMKDETVLITVSSSDKKKNNSNKDVFFEKKHPSSIKKSIKAKLKHQKDFLSLNNSSDSEDEFPSRKSTKVNVLKDFPEYFPKKSNSIEICIK